MEVSPELIHRIAISLDAIERYTNTDTGTWARACGFMSQLAADVCAMREQLAQLDGFDLLVREMRNGIYDLERKNEALRESQGLLDIARANAGRRVRSSRPAHKTKKRAAKKKS